VSTLGGSFGSQWLHVGTDWRVRCETYLDAPPILSVTAGDLTALVVIAARERMPAEAVAFARELTRQAARFAAECERLHDAWQLPADSEATATASAVRPGP
jgi:hypothetical protein